MPKLHISKRTVDAIEEPQTRICYWDDKLSGFGVRAAPGARPVYVLKYRVGGRQRFFKIGQHGSPWTPDQARAEALRLLGEVAKERDPAQERVTARAMPTFADVVATYFAVGVPTKKPRTIAADRARAKHHLIPLLGRLRVDTISRADIERMMNSVINRAASAAVIEKGAKRGAGSVVTGGRGVAAQCVALASAILAFAVTSLGLRADNPARGIKKPPVRMMERYLKTAEFAALGAALDEDAARTKAIYPVAAIRLLALTGCRLGEVRELKWSEVDLERRILDLRDSKSREKKVLISLPAAELLAALPRFNDCPFVFPGREEAASADDDGKPRRYRPTGAINKTWARVRTSADLKDVRLHDLRHSFASIGAGASVGLPIIGKLLGHTQAATTARYAHLADDPLRRAADAIGEAVAAAMRKCPEEKASWK